MADEHSPLKVGIPKENFPGERRVAAIPDLLPMLVKAGLAPYVQSGAGVEAGFDDAAYKAKGATLVISRKDIFETCDVVLQVRSYSANADAGKDDLDLIRKGQIIVGHCDPLSNPGLVAEMASRQATIFAIEMLPRITRAQSMDALSSMATIAGYKAVLMAADTLPLMFPMLMTAAGTIAAAHVFVVGAGVAGLQAIATAKRLGAVVRAYDVRPAVKEQVESLGAKFVEMALAAGDSEDKGGYAKEMDEDFYRRQREMMLGVVTESNVVITTAAIPGKKAPILITEEMVKAMPLGSVLVDLAAERGGNCELTVSGQTIQKHGVTIMGPVNLPSTIPAHASQMYGKNLLSFMRHLVKDGRITLDLEDEITRDTLLTHNGQLVNERVKGLLNS